MDEIDAPSFSRRRTLILTYDPATDTIIFDGAGLSPLEVRGIVALAGEQLDYTPFEEYHGIEEDDGE